MALQSLVATLQVPGDRGPNNAPRNHLLPTPLAAGMCLR